MILVSLLGSRSKFLVMTMLLFSSAAIAQEQGSYVPHNRYYGTGSWNEDSLGNHRAVLRVGTAGRAVRARIPWRRRDLHPEEKGAWVFSAAGEHIRNVHWIEVNREFGDVVFEPKAGPGEYYVYDLLYRSKGRNYPKGTYLPPQHTADAAWLEALGARGGSMPRSKWLSLPDAEFVQFQAIDELNSFFPMEVIATRDEVERLLKNNPQDSYLVFSEGREYSIRMTTDLPAKWIKDGPRKPLVLSSDRNEFYAFQLGVFAARSDVKIDKVTMSPLLSDRGEIPSSAFTCFNTEGTDWLGRQFSNPVSIMKGKIQALWMGIQVPENAEPGSYQGVITVQPEGMQPSKVELSLRVSEQILKDGGDNDPSRLTRLRWLNSRFAMDDDTVPPFPPLKVEKMNVMCLGREITLGRSGLPEQIRSYFSPENTSIVRQGKELLTGPVKLVIESPLGTVEDWQIQGFSFTKQKSGTVAWESHSSTSDIRIDVHGQMESDGYVDFQVVLTAERNGSIKDIRLDVPMASDAAIYMMGMGVKGGYRPDQFEWKWDVKHNQDAVWLGDVNGGFQISFRDKNYVRPLNTNFYLSKPLNMPPSWFNEGKGGFRFPKSNSATLLLQSYSGTRTVRQGEQLHFYFAFLITPFKLIDTDSQWETRFYHKFSPLDEIAATGANTINVHHATPINPYINYPFLRPAEMKAYVDDAHGRGFKVKIYHTVRELSNRAPELFMLRTLGDEVLSYGSGGGFSWLQEHLDSNYIAAWFVPELKDAAVVNSGVSRWHNYYVEGLNWLVRNAGIDGLYIDDVAFDRTTMKRVRKVLDRNRPGALIDLHSANQFNPRDGFANSANLYLEHFPYINRLWFGEYFDYNSSPDFWLVETSGIPFGLMGEMLEKGGNPWRGMLYGMTNRLPWAGNPAPLWKLWDDFGIRGTKMIGYWSEHCPVHTDNKNVLATVYTKKDSALLSIASWDSSHVAVKLSIDWKALGIDPSKATIVAPEIAEFQPSRIFRRDEAIPVDPGKGWLLILSTTTNQ